MAKFKKIEFIKEYNDFYIKGLKVILPEKSAKKYVEGGYAIYQSKNQ